MPDESQALVRALLGPAGRLVVVSNRGPLTFESDRDAPDGLSAARGAGGLVTALGELGRYAPLTWVATAMSDGDRQVAPLLPGGSSGNGRNRSRRDALGRRVGALIAQHLPGQDVELRLVDLPHEMRTAYYARIANPLLWFLQHRMYAPAYGPNIDADVLRAWRIGYVPANEAIADVVAATPEAAPVVLFQDYHLYLAPALVRARRPDATIAHFTHIPWPPAIDWQLLPQAMRRAICEGLLGADVVGLQTDRYAINFLDTVALAVRDAHVERDGRTVRWRGRRIPVRTYPISVDPDGLAAFARSAPVAERVDRLRERMERAGVRRLIVRADRMEPSKNALRGYLAFEVLLRRRPELRSEVRLLAVQAPTREGIAEYDAYSAAVREVVARINGLSEPDDQPVWITDGSDYAMAIAALRLADVVLVNPLIDGMNLVAKEAVLVGQRDPVLVLSETAGAAEQLGVDSLLVAPADIAGTAEQLERALAMPGDERRYHLRRLRASVRGEDVRWWLERQLRDLIAIRRGANAPSRRLRDTTRRVENALPSGDR